MEELSEKLFEVIRRKTAGGGTVGYRVAWVALNHAVRRAISADDFAVTVDRLVDQRRARKTPGTPEFRLSLPRELIAALPEAALPEPDNPFDPNPAEMSEDELMPCLQSW